MCVIQTGNTVATVAVFPGRGCGFNSRAVAVELSPPAGLGRGRSPIPQPATAARRRLATIILPVWIIHTKRKLVKLTQSKKIKQKIYQKQMIRFWARILLRASISDEILIDYTVTNSSPSIAVQHSPGGFSREGNKK